MPYSVAVYVTPLNSYTTNLQEQNYPVLHYLHMTTKTYFHSCV